MCDVLRFSSVKCWERMLSLISVAICVMVMRAPQGAARMIARLIYRVLVSFSCIARLIGIPSWDEEHSRRMK